MGGPGAGQGKPLEEPRWAHRRQPDARRLAGEGHRGASWPTGHEDGETAQPRHPEHGISHVVPVDGVPARSRAGAERQHLAAVFELQERRRARAVQDEGLALVGDVPGHGRRRRTAVVLLRLAENELAEQAGLDHHRGVRRGGAGHGEAKPRQDDLHCAPTGHAPTQWRASGADFGQRQPCGPALTFLQHCLARTHI